MEGVGFKESSWDVRDKEFNEDIIQVATKYGLTKSIHNELEDNQEEYCSITHEEWYDLMSTMEIK